MPEFDDWKAYFDWLGRRPWVFQRMVDWPDAGHTMTVPELRPEWFDDNYAGRVEWKAAERTGTPRYSAVDGQSA